MAKILVIDDEPVIGHIVRLLLESEGHLVLVADDGSRGYATACRQRPEMIILDVMMPVMDGFAVLEALQADHRTAAIPTVMLSAIQNEGVEQRCYGLGAKGYVRKPFDAEGLLEAVNTVLRGEPTPAGSA
jgi:CheY-like chemotaxis protein